MGYVTLTDEGNTLSEIQDREKELTENKYAPRVPDGKPGIEGAFIISIREK